jgi:hypothetical protein
MGNGGAKWRGSGFFRVDVNELVIVGRISETVNAFLVNQQPVRWPEFGTSGVFEILDGYIAFNH